jgi:L-alanine-DL-glutamate epimerase-like enolase superfamily enzyme
MKIRKIEIFYFNIPLREPFKISIGTMPGANNVLVKILTDSGLTGLGEACPFPPITGETQETNISAARSLRDLLIGKDPLAIENFVRDAASFLSSNPSIVAAFDMALYDILGKASSLPLFRLLGGAKSTLETDITADLDTPRKMAAKAKRFVTAGYKKIKIKVGQSPEMDLARLEAIREAIGYDEEISIDANQGWTVPQAISALKRMEKFKIQYVEQPVAAWDISGLRAVRQQSPIPVMADEALFSPHDAIKLVKEEACDYFNIKLMKSGGILNALKIAHIGESANIRAMVGCMLETRLALTAAAHVMAAQSNIIFADLDGNASHTVDPVRGGMIVKGGVITLPQEPGLGVDIDPAFLKKVRKV